MSRQARKCMNGNRRAPTSKRNRRRQLGESLESNIPSGSDSWSIARYMLPGEPSARRDVRRWSISAQTTPEPELDLDFPGFLFSTGATEQLKLLNSGGGPGYGGLRSPCELG
ncbi:hypothetical protein PCASD_16730 [Puccinia coronata f. sp. avenae]|uniref:Uncharacterized protein n=1 Tax=Puccinia coronata f. sp. avenae TaxID=200324 RepID=A0A2N5S5E3_9BASI|nr:hypothetical protein PCASD_21439 [Puccinia coronata f. sp. avenae]PLW30107.1 hypothetical protein PCASD_16730 [Puccinia coronata f. sp. avenae]